MAEAAAVHFTEIDLSSPEYAAAVALRNVVLREPLGLEFTPEEMAGEPACVHLAGLRGGEVVATILLQPIDSATVKMRQVAVRADLQGIGIGGEFLAFVEGVARQRGFRKMVAHARRAALAFYERHGYTAEGAEFVEATIPHRLVSKEL